MAKAAATESHTDRDIYAARLRACDAKTGFPCLAHALLSMVPIITDKVATLGTDRYWRCYINPHFFETLTPDQGAMVLVHEVWHLLLEHSQRAENKCIPLDDHDRWNIAADMEINQHDDLLKRLPPIPDPKDPSGPAQPPIQPVMNHPPVCVWNFPPHQLAERYYDMLLRFPLPQKLHVCAGHCGGSAGNEPGPEDIGPPNGKDGNGQRIPGVSDTRAKIITQETARQITEEASQQRGNVPAGWTRWAERTLKPKVDWRSLIRPTIQGMVISKSGHYSPTYNKPARRQHLYPDMIRPTYKDIIPKVAMIIDTSGSMSDSMVGQGIAEVDGVLTVLNYRGEVDVYFTDAAAAEVQKCTCANTLIPIGGGGTDMCEGFKAVEEAAKKNPLDKPQILIVVTDGYTPWPDKPPEDTMVMLVMVADGTIPAWAGTFDCPLIKVPVEEKEAA